jgi:hypothetical protein
VPDTRARVSGWLIAAVIVAFLLALVAGGALVWANRDRDDAQQQQQRLEAELAVRRDAGSPDRLAATSIAIDSVRPQLTALPAEMQQVVDLQQQDALLVRAALAAGKKADVPAYNEAVDKRNTLAPQVDAAVEKLRVDVNAVLLALAKVTNRTAP